MVRPNSDSSRPIMPATTKTTPLTSRKTTAKERQRQLQDDIIELILELKLAPGDPMPTETQLNARLGAGRNSLREALKVLEGLGIVEVRHGFGTFVGGNALDAMTRSLTFRGRATLYQGGREAIELVDVRHALETGLISLICPLISEEQLEKVRLAVEGMETSVNAGQDWSEWDKKFHALLYEPLGNQLLSELLDVFWQVYNNLSDDLDAVAPTSLEQAGGLVASHRAIYEALKVRDSATATELMNQHFGGIRGRLTSWRKSNKKHASAEEPSR